MPKAKKPHQRLINRFFSDEIGREKLQNAFLVTTRSAASGATPENTYQLGILHQRIGRCGEASVYFARAILLVEAKLAGIKNRE